ncbi:SO2930 family diheme c-type cytochrome [Cytophagales bacterium LB-30]|uniref:SO2930 family diheme c-type cytochrome n=1 Tax=Shiella aurantiaca TaxID=3058365 RepID=A0ABT8F7F6_9BACT|nr:SO2930 family diheme c-type cytochrome [Shiella aurantiaca]MDN4166218.1 SO2930 family diheme c-type cytochrome [Shiella aurantiaca]
MKVYLPVSKIRIFLGTLASVFFFLACLYACTSEKKQNNQVIEEVALDGTDTKDIGPATLSSYGFFVGKLADLQPANDLIPYELNTPLFTDYAHKLRFIKLPEGSTMKYHPSEVLDFPVGTVLIKNFYYPLDFRQPHGERNIIETRLLTHKEAGWEALTYVWNEEQTEAYLQIAGDTRAVAWLDEQGQNRQVNYSVPSVTQCKGCHEKSEKLMPIGPTVRQLNQHGEANQIVGWEENGWLSEAPPKHTWPQVPIWDKAETGVLDARARAWLEINCAHCHRAEGPAKTSGLFLLTSETNPLHVGVGKPPVAAGKGSGGLQYGIVPGKPEESILYYRINSSHPGIMMPELGRKLIHTEGVALIKQWIEEMEK